MAAQSDCARGGPGGCDRLLQHPGQPVPRRVGLFADRLHQPELVGYPACRHHFGAGFEVRLWLYCGQPLGHAAIVMAHARTHRRADQRRGGLELLWLCRHPLRQLGFPAGH